MERTQDRAVTDADVAACILVVAESRTLSDLGAACCHAITTLTGSSAAGLYQLKDNRPELLYSWRVPEGFLNEYGARLARSDPMLESIYETMRPVIGDTLRVNSSGKTRLMNELLGRWGFSANMCGPIVQNDKLFGVVYAAKNLGADRYTEKYSEYMHYICRAASVALDGMSAQDRWAAKDVQSPYPAHDFSRKFRNESKLPQRAAEVATLLCQGRTNKEIARMMVISHYTVKEHVSNLCRKFNVQNRTELASRLLEAVGSKGQQSIKVPLRPNKNLCAMYNGSSLGFDALIAHDKQANETYSADYF